jgi:hypothetical protein
MVWLRLALIAFGIALFAAANLAADTVDFGSPSDKLNHFAAFALLSPLAIVAFPNTSLIRLMLALLMFNATIEASQAVLGAGRQADVFDWLSGALATLTAVATAALWKSHKPEKTGGPV